LYESPRVPEKNKHGEKGEDEGGAERTFAETRQVQVPWMQGMRAKIRAMIKIRRIKASEKS